MKNISHDAYSSNSFGNPSHMNCHSFVADLVIIVWYIMLHNSWYLTVISAIIIFATSTLHTLHDYWKMHLISYAIFMWIQYIYSDICQITLIYCFKMVFIIKNIYIKGRFRSPYQHILLFIMKNKDIKRLKFPLSIVFLPFCNWWWHVSSSCIGHALWPLVL